MKLRFWMSVVMITGCVSANTSYEVLDPPVAPDPLVERLSLGAVLRSRTRHFLVARETTTEEVPLDGGCTLFRVNADGGLRDLDLEVWSAAGERLLVDDAPDAEPALQLCGFDTVVFIRIRAYAGAGLATFFVFSSPDERDLSRLGRGAATLHFAEPEPPLPIEEMNALASRGFVLVDEQAFEVETAADVLVSSGFCYTAIVRSVMPTEIHAIIDDLVVARSIQNVVQWCVPPSSTATVRLTGQGEMRLWLFRADRNRIGGDAGLWLGDRSNPQRSATSMANPLTQ